MDDVFARYKIMTSEWIIHSQIRIVNNILKRDVDFAITLNNRRAGSCIEFDALDSEARAVKDQLECTLLTKNNAGWMPVI